MASIQTLDRGTRRKRHVVRYKDEQGKHRGKTFKLKTHAKVFEAEVARVKQRRQALTGHGVDIGNSGDRTTVLALVDDWLMRYGGLNGQLEESTRGKWRSAINVGLRPHPRRT